MALEPNKKSMMDRIRGLNRNTLGILICAAVIILVLLIYLLSRGGANGTGKNDKPVESMTPEAYAQIGDSDISGVETDSGEGDPWRTLNDEEYSIRIDCLEKGYTGTYMEDGTDEEVKNVLAVKFTNQGTQDIQYAEYVFGIGKQVVSFKLSNLPVGQSCLVLETTRHEFKKKEALSLVSRVVAQVEELPLAQDQVLVVDNSDDTITIMNLTQEELPVVRAFYKSFDAEENMFLGGITYTAKAEKIPAGGGVTVAPAHFTSGKSVIVGTGVYEEDAS